ncbi:MAG: M23 family peptidase, partial [Rubrivivax sp.]|nr:M23 family peptidase [Rubrivivax sp.]
MKLPSVPAAQDLERFGQRHRKAIVLAGVALLAGTGITAVAVAPMVPDAALLPQRLVLETIEPTGLQSQLDALAAQDLSLTRSDITRSTDTVEALLARLGVRDSSAAQFLRTDFHGRQVVTGRGGKLVQVNTLADGSLQDLVLRYPSDQSELSKTHFNRVTVVRGPDGRWISRLLSVPYESHTRLASGTIRSSLFGATDEAGVPDAV